MSAPVRRWLRALLVAVVAFLVSGSVHAYVESLPAEENACPDVEAVACEAGHDDDDDRGCGDDCVGPTHHCSCCANLLVVCPSRVRVGPPLVREADRPPPLAVRADLGVSWRVERPPRS